MAVSSVARKEINTSLMLREWPYTASSRDALENTSDLEISLGKYLSPRGMYRVFFYTGPPLKSQSMENLGYVNLR